MRVFNAGKIIELWREHVVVDLPYCSTSKRIVVCWGNDAFYPDRTMCSIYEDHRRPAPSGNSGWSGEAWRNLGDRYDQLVAMRVSSGRALAAWKDSNWWDDRGTGLSTIVRTYLFLRESGMMSCEDGDVVTLNRLREIVKDLFANKARRP